MVARTDHRSIALCPLRSVTVRTHHQQLTTKTTISTLLPEASVLILGGLEAMSTDQIEMRNPGELSMPPGQTTVHVVRDSQSITADPNTAIVHDTTVPYGGYGWVAVFGCAVIT
jgi:uncharacterized GH25 family protein